MRHSRIDRENIQAVLDIIGRMLDMDNDEKVDAFWDNLVKTRCTFKTARTSSPKTDVSLARVDHILKTDTRKARLSWRSALPPQTLQNSQIVLTEEDDHFAFRF